VTAEDDRAKRQAENERLLRESNWELAVLNAEPAAAAAGDEELLFLCACGLDGCRERICLTLDEYRAAHEAPHRFIVVPDHVTPDIERVVERHPGYAVVEKRPGYQGSDPTWRGDGTAAG
jgi:hypothetical protein